MTALDLGLSICYHSVDERFYSYHHKGGQHVQVSRYEGFLDPFWGRRGWLGPSVSARPFRGRQRPHYRSGGQLMRRHRGSERGLGFRGGVGQLHPKNAYAPDRGGVRL